MNSDAKRTACILMSTYNGEKYIDEQIKSIVEQEDINVHLIVRDDGSSDRTVDIIKTYMNQGVDIELVQGKNIGPAESFLELIYRGEEYQYYALADQDDIWHTAKICSAVKQLMKFENQPTLYYSAVTLVDSDGKPLSARAHTEKATTDNGLFGFYATGCTIVYNKRMHELLMKYRPNDIFMHDAWLLTVACYCGKVIYDEHSYIDYRQHEGNVIGMAKKRSLLKKASDFFEKNRGRHSALARELMNGYFNDISDENIRKFITDASKCPQSIKHRIHLIKSRQFQSLSKKNRIKVGRQIILGVF